MGTLLFVMVGLQAVVSASAGDPFMTSETVLVQEVKGPIPDRVDDALWRSIPPATVLAYPQHSLHLNDKVANAALQTAKPRKLSVRAAVSSSEIGVHVEWEDATEDRIRPDETSVFGDAVALQVPQRFGEGIRLPYVGMGDEANPVVLYHQRAASTGQVVRTAVAAGFGSSTRAAMDGVRMSLGYDVTTHRWRAVFVRPLVAHGGDLRQGLIPFALAVWDGNHSERGGNKSLTAWKFLRVPNRALSERYVNEVAWGHRPGDLGDVAKGRILVESVCVACHHVGEKRLAAPGMAPDLTTIGGIASPSYLRDSITQPSEVVVPSPNPNQHLRRPQAPGVTEVFPTSGLSDWSTVDAQGKRVSRMPSFGTMSKEDVAAMVAYLRTLGVTTSTEQEEAP
ncbi:MAG: c-type cytochrome [Myxococcota bacterium]